MSEKRIRKDSELTIAEKELKKFEKVCRKNHYLVTVLLGSIKGKPAKEILKEIMLARKYAKIIDESLRALLNL